MKLFYIKLAIGIAICLGLVLMYNAYQVPSYHTVTITYSDFLKKIDNGVLKKLKIQENLASWSVEGGDHYECYIPDDPQSIAHFAETGVEVELLPPKEIPWILLILLPLMISFGIWYYFSGKNSGFGRKLKSLGKSGGKFFDVQKSTVRFKDVAGIDEAKEELIEIVDFLSAPSRFTESGAQIPTGILLYGEPGTGKTLLARAIAGEAGVPFFSISGSSFVEMYVGVGASRVRDLFAIGKKKAPCIIFIDEIDAVGRHRSKNAIGGNDEREQTLNQLLVEMDGFEESNQVIVIAATNRIDMLDEALLRPGRFDRQVNVPLPDIAGREYILQVHAQKIKVDEDIDWHAIARSTPGFSGAELANMINEAALLGARAGGVPVNMDILEAARDKVMMGAERRSMIITPMEKEIAAYHEIGHALVAWMLPEADPVHKVTIIPRGKSLGMTMQLPEIERHTHSCSYLFDTMCVLLGGRVAEEIVFDQITTGSSNDIERVSNLARNMVCKWGMVAEIGPVVYDMPEQPGVAGPVISEETANTLNREVNRLIQAAYTRTKTLIANNPANLKDLSQLLLEKETISRNDMSIIIEKNKGTSGVIPLVMK